MIVIVYENFWDSAARNDLALLWLKITREVTGINLYTSVKHCLVLDRDLKRREVQLH